MQTTKDFRSCDEQTKFVKVPILNSLSEIDAHLNRVNKAWQDKLDSIKIVQYDEDKIAAIMRIKRLLEVLPPCHIHGICDVYEKEFGTV